MALSETQRSAQSPGHFHRLFKRLRHAPLSAWFGMVVLAIYLTAALFAPLLAPYGEYQVVSDAPFTPWSSQFILGTDQLGRDLFSRLIFGARNSIGIAFATTLLAFVLGGSFGIIAATVRGIVDQVLSRIVDSVISIPDIIFTLMLLTIFGSSVMNLMAIIAIIDSTRIFRLSRAAAFNVVTLEFVEAARARGERLPWIVVQEILPNILPILISEFGTRFCFVFLAIAALSFLGVGLQPPMAEWGSMVRDNAALISSGDITPLIPAAAIALLTIAVNFVADWFLNESSGLSDEGR